MCYETKCPICKKSTWKGCGRHIESALGNIPIAERCPGWKTGVCTNTPNVKASDKAIGSPNNFYRNLFKF